MLTQRIFDPRGHPREDRARDDALTFKIAQLHRQHVLTHSGDRSSQFVEAAWTSQELPQDQHFPFATKNRQGRVDFRRWLAKRSGAATGLGHIFHTTPQKLSFLCARCRRRYFTSSFTSTWGPSYVTRRNRTNQPFQGRRVLGFENPVRACFLGSLRCKDLRSTDDGRSVRCGPTRPVVSPFHG